MISIIAASAAIIAPIAAGGITWKIYGAKKGLLVGLLTITVLGVSAVLGLGILLDGMNG